MAAEGRSLTALVEAATGGEEAAWGTLVERFLPLVWAVIRAHGLERAAAEEANAEVWLRLVEHLGRIRDPEALAGWLRTTTKNECLRTLRRGRETRLDWTDLESLPDERTAEEAVLADDRTRVVAQALARLSAKCQALLRVLAYSPDAAYAEISRALDMPVGSIGPTRSRCLDRLRDRLQAVGYLAVGR